MRIYQNLVDMVGKDNALVVVIFVALAILVSIFKPMFQSKKKEQTNETSVPTKESDKPDNE
jgi:hypothetical protein